MGKVKISQLPAKGDNLENTDLLPIAEDAGGGAYVTKRIDGSQISAGGSQDLQSVTDIGNSTTNDIQVVSSVTTSTIGSSQIITGDDTTGAYASLNYSGTVELGNGVDNGIGALAVTNVDNASVQLEFPNKATGSYTIATTSDLTSGTVTSVDLTMPSAFSVSGNPITTSGTLAVTGAGTVSQYVRGDGTLANFPSISGGGASTSYYLNGSVNQGTIGGVTYYEMNKVPILGTGTNFTRNTNGYIASFLTDANDPALLKIPGGNWNLEIYFSASSGGGTPTFYVELYKYDGTTFSLIASSSTNPEGITGGTITDAYFTTLSVPETVLTATDRLAFRIYVTPSGRTITLHTEDNNLCQIITTFTTGLTALNGLTDQVQNFATGTSGTDFGISSSGSTHTFNLPIASATNTGKLSAANWTTFNGKQDALVSGTNIKTVNLNSLLGSGDLSVGTVTSVSALTLGTTGTDLNSSVATGTTTPVITLNVPTASATNRGALSSTDWTTFNNKQNALTLTTTGTSGAATLVGSTLNIPQYSGGGGSLTVGTTAIASGTVGRVLFEGTGNVLQEDAALFWDNTNKRLGIGATPSTSVRLDVRAQGALSTDIAFRVRNSADSVDIVSISGESTFNIGSFSGGNNISNSSNGLDLNTNSRDIRLQSSNRIRFTTNSSLRAFVSQQGNLIFSSSLSSDPASMVNGIAMYNGTAPSGNITAGFSMYSTNIVAGNAAPHFRTENGDIVKLYRVAGWGLPTGTFTRTTFDTATVTTAQLAERVAALIQDLRDNHGLLKA